MTNTFNPLVSIIIPVYNGSNYMREAINSALAQTYKNIEIIVVNDGSKDNTEEIAKSYGNKIKYFYKDNGGVATALNLALEKSKGDYISWLSHDDLYSQNKVERQITELKKLKNKNTILYTNWLVIDKNGKRINEINIKNDHEDSKLSNSLYLIVNGLIHGCSLLIPKLCFNEAGFFNPELKATQDYDLWYKMFPKYPIKLIPEPLIKSRWHDEQGSKTLDALKESDDFWVNLLKTLEKNEVLSIAKDELSFYKKIETITKKAKYFNANKYAKNEINKILGMPTYEFSNLQVGDTDLVGNKFNGHNLHLYLQEKGWDSNHLVAKKESSDKTTFLLSPYLNKYRFLFKNIEKMYDIQAQMYPFMYDVLKNRLFLDADIVHYHLVNNYLFNLHLLPIATKLKPSVVHLHDPWLLSGKCIHHFDCDKWQKSCGDCPNLSSVFAMDKDNTALNFEIKKTAIQNSQISFIAASKWVYEKAKKSPILEGKTIYNVPDSVNQEIFKPADIKTAKKALNIDENSITLMFRSDDNIFKGLDIIKDALQKIKSKSQITLLTVSKKGMINELCDKYKIIECGWVTNDEVLAKIYQACDIFLMPSKMETFGLMAIEAMSCGKPVLSIEGTGVAEVINSPECGLVTQRNALAYAKELQNLIDNPLEILKRGEKSLEYAKANYSHKVYVDKIIEIYKNVIAEHKKDEAAKYLLFQLKKHMQEEPIEKNSFSRFLKGCVSDLYFSFVFPLIKIVYNKLSQNKITGSLVQKLRKHFKF